MEIKVRIVVLKQTISVYSHFLLFAFAIRAFGSARGICPFRCDVRLNKRIAHTFKHEISSNNYASKEVREDYLVNLAVVIEDVETQKRTLASEEFNIISPTLTIQIANENSVVVNTQQVATVTFTSPFAVPVNGELTVMGSGLLEEKVQIRLTLKPGEAMKRPVQFTPRMTGSKMLQASLVLTNMASVLHGFKTINVKQA